ncbi:MAG: hypothetical protein O7D34_04235 [Ignavibacteria bacterium]|nr:hypothetical protein [Ignavibacteria bacterium]
MRIIEYSPGRYDALMRAVESISPTSGLFHRPFVNYYYSSNDWCKLFLALDANDRIVGTIGVDRMRFESESGEMTLGFASNYYSLLPGAGAFLFMKRLKDCPLGVVFGGGEDTHKVASSLGWTYFAEILNYHLNWSYPTFPEEASWRKVAKWVMRNSSRKKIGKYTSRLLDASREEVSVHPERSFSNDLLPQKSPFSFRFAPSLAYLNWRYNTELSFVRYRLFRILAGQTTVGYVVINDKPDCLYVAQCDGIDPVTLAYGVMSSIVEVGKQDRHPRTVMLTSSHSVMQALYRQFGFRAGKSVQRFAVGGYKQVVTLNPDTSGWLINFDWGDNGLCSPFLDQVATAGVSGD